MKINRILYIEDESIKYSDVSRFLQRIGGYRIDRAKNAEEAFSALASAVEQGQPYDLLLSDMHFDFFGENDRNAGEKVMQKLRENGNEIPVVFCSSQNWNIPGALGNIFYHPQRDWEEEADLLFRRIESR